MEEKAAERHPDYLTSSSAVLQCLQMHEDAIQVFVDLLYSSTRLDMSPYSSRSCRMRFMEEKAASKLPDRLILPITTKESRYNDNPEAVARIRHNKTKK